MPKKSATAGGTTLSLCPFPAGRQAVAAASSLSLRGITKNPHNTHTHPRRIARQHLEAGRRSTRGSMRLEVKARPKGVRSSRITPKKHSTTARPASHVSSSLAHGLSLRLAPYAVASGKHKNPEKKTKPDLRKPNILTRQHIKTT